MPLVVWSCPKCKQTATKFLAPGETNFRVCGNSFKPPCRYHPLVGNPAYFGMCSGPDSSDSGVFCSEFGEELPPRWCKSEMCNTQMTVALDERPVDQRGEDVDLETAKLMTILRTCEAATDKIRKRSESSYDIIKAMGVVFRGMKKE